MSTAPLVTFKKPSRRPLPQTRKRSISPPPPPLSISSSSTPSNQAESSTSTSVIRPTKKSLLNPLIQGTAKRRRPEDTNGGGLAELEYRANEDGLINGGGDVYATKTNEDYAEVSVGDEEARKRIKVNEVGSSPVL